MVNRHALRDRIEIFREIKLVHYSSTSTESSQGITYKDKTIVSNIVSERSPLLIPSVFEQACGKKRLHVYSHSIRA